MSQQLFVDLLEEMKILEESYLYQGGSLLTLSGRRRNGKTELIGRFIGNGGVYFLATAV